jgi:hypothetical protein
MAEPTAAQTAQARLIGEANADYAIETRHHDDYESYNEAFDLAYGNVLITLHDEQLPEALEDVASAAFWARIKELFVFVLNGLQQEESVEWGDVVITRESRGWVVAFPAGMGERVEHVTTDPTRVQLLIVQEAQVRHFQVPA